MTDIYFSLKPGYEELASEMIAYADAHMSVKGGEIQLMLFGGQDALMNAAKQAGYHQNQKIEICSLILMTYWIIFCRKDSISLIPTIMIWRR